MNILVLGSGGREHALAWAVKQNPKCDRLVCAPGNAGMAAIADCVAVDVMDNDAVLALCQAESIDFAIIGAENPLANGVADVLRAAGILTFGPSKAAAELESSKAFTKEICDACNAPTAAYARFTELNAAKAYVTEQGAPIVIKADGLAAGKGVIVAMELQDALNGLDDIFDGAFGDAGAEVVIEEFMDGEEASFFILSDGKNILPMGTAQDHKRAYDGDKGPNTGGMGAYSPAPVMTDAVTQKALDEIIQPTIDEMARRGTPFQGVLFAGFMIKDGQPRLVEYNVRFGDPECQTLMMRLGAQVLDALLACAEERLADAQIHWANDHAVSIVLA
ncbi:MAG: phosphoribosylamine--glycine ligase, partial [Proteobacteria bacterium]|nr:phosphoribosylamine--glycine ligase [Pseudomonadota bacterium]